MSELSIFSIVVAMGDIRREVSRLLEDLGISLSGSYSTTMERESAAQNAYLKNRIRLEAEYLPKKLEPKEQVLLKETKNKGLMRGIHVLAIDDAITRIQPLATVARKKHGEKLKKASALVQTIKTHFEEAVADAQAVDLLALKCEPLLRETAKDAHYFLSKTEDLVAVETLSGELSGLGYDVHRNGRDIVGAKGKVCLRARAEGGRLRLDSTAYPGLSCQKEMARLERALRRKGLVLGRICEDPFRKYKKNHQLKDLFPSFEKEVLKGQIAASSISAKQTSARNLGIKPEYHRHLLLNRMHQINMNRIKRGSP